MSYQRLLMICKLDAASQWKQYGYQKPAYLIMTFSCAAWDWLGSGSGLQSSQILKDTKQYICFSHSWQWVCFFPSLYSQTVRVAGSIEAKHLSPSFLPAGLIWARGFVEAMQVPLGVERAPLGREGSGPLALLGGPTRSNMEELTRWIAAAQWPYLNGSC